ncbi:histidine kinase [Actinobacillus seminis]|uniref:Histidine kinase n=1 Tax=Actinobacillus seminis TaxID=722 RepID=A0A263HAS1_9PAST|nr:DUF294 nucleotidyltransferase-like domain-containing protein [Actinobacillus seminis]OZN24554.1 histidine kinase [Actinobacillus seminis]SUU38651.1 inosine 5'-monophosphate dehydrogenase [Actinobacillus seminis]
MDNSLIPNIELFIAEVSPFNHLPKPLISQIANNIQIRYVPKGEIVVSMQTPQDFLYIVRTGEVEQINASGQLRAKLEAGDVFGFSIFDTSHAEKYTAYAIENSLIYQISYHFINQILKQHPHYADYFSTNTSTRLASLRHQVMKGADNIFIKTVAEIANPKVALVAHTSSIQQAALAMTIRRRSSALVMQNDRLVGIVTDRDMTKKVVAHNVDVQTPVTAIMTPQPPVIAADDLVLNAVSLMMQHNIRSLPVVNEGKIEGILTATDLVKYHNVQSIFIINHIFQANSLPLLIEVAKQQQGVFSALIESSASFDNVMKVMTLIADAFHRKLLMMAEHQFGAPPCGYAWVVAGSQARYEIHPLSDQDNALIVERPLNDAEKAYFKQLARFVNEGLHQCGYARCSGNYMASNPRWCQSLAEWKNDFTNWVRYPELDGLLNASVLMDMRGIYGETRLADELQQHFVDLIANNKRFLAFLTANAIRVKPPLSIFRHFVVSKDGENKNMLNLKKRAISLLADLGRIYALAAGVSETMSTKARFEISHKLGILDQVTLENALGAYEFVCDLRFKFQLTQLQQQQSLTNHIDPRELTSFHRNHLKDAFRLIAKIQEAAELRFSQRGMIR